MRKGDAVPWETKDMEGWRGVAAMDSRLHRRTGGGMKTTLVVYRLAMTYLYRYFKGFVAVVCVLIAGCNGVRQAQVFPNSLVPNDAQLSERKNDVNSAGQPVSQLTYQIHRAFEDVVHEAKLNSSFKDWGLIGENKNNFGIQRVEKHLGTRVHFFRLNDAETGLIVTMIQR